MKKLNIKNLKLFEITILQISYLKTYKNEENSKY